MPTYKVTLVRRTVDFCDVEVDAEDDWDARDKAMEVACEGDCDWRDEDVDEIYPKEPELLEPYDFRNEPDYEA